jgi:hypothetical protein
MAAAVPLPASAPPLARTPTTAAADLAINPQPMMAAFVRPLIIVPQTMVGADRTPLALLYRQAFRPALATLAISHWPTDTIANPSITV